jgi:hypothetical protein
MSDGWVRGSHSRDVLDRRGSVGKRRHGLAWQQVAQGV